MFLLARRAERRPQTPELEASGAPLNGGGAGHGPGPITIGVGDGGNEIGMGSVRTLLAREGRLVARTASVVPVRSSRRRRRVELGRLRHRRRSLDVSTAQPLLHTPADRNAG